MEIKAEKQDGDWFVMTKYPSGATDSICILDKDHAIQLLDAIGHAIYGIGQDVDETTTPRAPSIKEGDVVVWYTDAGTRLLIEVTSMYESRHGCPVLDGAVSEGGMILGAIVQHVPVLQCTHAHYCIQCGDHVIDDPCPACS